MNIEYALAVIKTNREEDEHWLGYAYASTKNLGFCMIDLFKEKMITAATQIEIGPDLIIIRNFVSFIYSEWDWVVLLRIPFAHQRTMSHM